MLEIPQQPLTNLTGQMHMVRKKIADTTGEIASMIIEDPAGEWPEMLPFLFQSGRSANIPLRESAMLIIARLTFAASEVCTSPQHAQPLLTRHDVLDGVC